MPKLIGNNEAAELLGMKPAAFAKGVRQGRFKAAGRGKNNNPLYNPTELKTAYNATESMAMAQDGAALLPAELKGGRPKTTPQGNDNMQASLISQSFLKAKTQNEITKAQTQKLKFETLSGQVISKSLVEKQGMELATVLMGILNSWPARLAPEFSSMKDADEHDFNLKLTREVNLLIREIIDKCQEN